jgi:hypothetical protein
MTISATAGQRGGRPHSSHATAAAANPKAAISLNASCADSTNNKPIAARLPAPAPRMSKL